MGVPVSLDRLPVTVLLYIAGRQFVAGNREKIKDLVCEDPVAGHVEDERAGR